MDDENRVITVDCLACSSRNSYAAADLDEPACSMCMKPLPWVMTRPFDQVDLYASRRERRAHRLLVAWPRFGALAGVAEWGQLRELAVDLCPEVAIVAVTEPESEEFDTRGHAKRYPYDIALWDVDGCLGAGFGQYQADDLLRWVRDVLQQGVPLEAASPEMLYRLLGMYEQWTKVTGSKGLGSREQNRRIARRLNLPEDALLRALESRHEVAHPVRLITSHEATQALSTIYYALQLYREQVAGGSHGSSSPLAAGRGESVVNARRRLETTAFGLQERLADARKQLFERMQEAP